MNKTRIIIIIIVIVLSIIVFYNWKEKSKSSKNSFDPKKNTDTSITIMKDTISKIKPTSKKIIETHENSLENQKQKTGNTITWKKYINSKTGIEFDYPIIWQKLGEEKNIVDRFGNIIAIEVNFINTKSKSSLLIRYYFPPKGAELFNEIVTQYDFSKGDLPDGVKLIMVANQKAIERQSISSLDGRGNIINPPEKLILIDFLDNSLTGEIHIQFRTQLPKDEEELGKFNNILSTVKLKR